MSAFPRRVPRNVPRLDTTFSRVFGGIVLSSPVVTYGVGEYFGWWRWMEPGAPGSAERHAFDTFREDIEAEITLTNTLGNARVSSTAMRNLRKADEIEEMPAGIKEYIKNPEIRDVKVKTMKAVKTWNVPEELDALVFTSAKKDKQEKIEVNEATPTKEVSATETNKSEIKEESVSSS